MFLRSARGDTIVSISMGELYQRGKAPPPPPTGSELSNVGINYLFTYDFSGPVYNRFPRGECITWVSGGGGGPGHSWDLKWHERSECHLGPGVSIIQEIYYTRGQKNQWSIGSFM